MKVSLACTALRGSQVSSGLYNLVQKSLIKHNR